MQKNSLLLSISLGFTLLSLPVQADILDLHKLQKDPTYQFNIFENQEFERGDLSEKSKKAIDKAFPATYQKLKLEQGGIVTDINSLPSTKFLPTNTITGEADSGKNKEDPIKRAISGAFNAQGKDNSMIKCTADVESADIGRTDKKDTEIFSLSYFRFTSACTMSY